MSQVVKFLMVAEIEVGAFHPLSPPGERVRVRGRLLTSEQVGAIAQAQATLDSFRESILPSENYGVTLYRVTPDDLTGDLLNRQVEVTISTR